MVDHGGGEHIDRFRLRVGKERPPIVERVDRIALPEGVWANAVVALPEGRMAVTSMFDPRDSSFIEKFASAQTTGRVWLWSQETGWQPLHAPSFSGANGIAVSRDGKTLFVSEWAARRVWRVSLDTGAIGFVPVSFLPDNLRWSDDGMLLVAGQISTPQAVFNCEADERVCPLGFAVAAIDPIDMAVIDLLHADHAQAREMGFGGGTGAIRVDDRIWVGSFTGERVALFAHPMVEGSASRESLR